MKRAWWAGLALLAFPSRLPAQHFSVSAARWLVSPHASEYRFGFGSFRKAAVRIDYVGQVLNQGGASRAHWYGAGVELITSPTQTARPYLLAGFAVGAGRGAAGGGEEPGVGAWGGLGAEIFTVGPLGLQAEVQYSWRSGVQLRGVVLALKIGSRIGRPGKGEEPLPPADLPKANPADEEILGLVTAARAGRAPAAEVVATALSAMGTPYRWGGTGPDGFDCSGLIQYAYATHGIALPRRSTEQARAGTEVGPRLSSLLPGDILTFSGQPGGGIEHVGLYLGEGRFIHSARGGVQISELSPGDPVGRWWWQRWVGARRVL